MKPSGAGRGQARGLSRVNLRRPTLNTTCANDAAVEGRRLKSNVCLKQLSIFQFQELKPSGVNPGGQPGVNLHRPTAGCVVEGAALLAPADALGEAGWPDILFLRWNFRVDLLKRLKIFQNLNGTDRR